LRTVRDDLGIFRHIVCDIATPGAGRSVAIATRVKVSWPVRR
jgi:hypothetical protein